MEDWQNSSLEEKVDLDNLVLFPPDSYPDTERRDFGKDIKKEQSIATSLRTLLTMISRQRKLN
jgi:hypothetical protein